jgi:NifB/MoaA-like Fe-S oxidoreductase
VVYPADEWYLLAGRQIPDEAFYGDMSQLENGVGLIALLRSEFTDALENTEEVTAKGTKTLLVTGMAAAPLLESLVALAKEKFPQINAQVKAVRNDFFGETITVAGLVTGTDILKQVTAGGFERILMPDVMLRHEGDRFLDDVTPQTLEEKIGVPVLVLPVDGEALLTALLQ